MYELMAEDTFDAAHALRGYDGPCENLHGHTWKVQVFLSGKKLNKLGLLEDFKSIKKTLKDLLAEFDHGYLNELKQFKNENPSSENIARFIFNAAKDKIPSLTKVTVWESATTCASYTE
jgi:6-pyruvoyltetrahydropterin/6-carboxytetrahydropterin synthase